VGVRYAVKQLREKGIVERVGSNRHGTWHIKDVD